MTSAAMATQLFCAKNFEVITRFDPFVDGRLAALSVSLTLATLCPFKM